MATKKPLVLGASGEIEQLQAGDSIEVGSSNQSFGAVNNNAGAISLGQVVYIDGDGTVDLAQANNETTTKAIGLVEDATIATTDTGEIITDGVLVSADWTSVTGGATLVPGSSYFLSDTTAGGMSTIPPTLAGSFVLKLGSAISATEFEISIGALVKL